MTSSIEFPGNLDVSREGVFLSTLRYNVIRLFTISYSLLDIIVAQFNKRIIQHSQVFIKDSKLVERLVERAGITKEDTVVEIGIGTGKITRVLAKYAGKVIGVEADPKYYEKMKVELKFENVKLHKGNFLKFDLPKEEPYKIVANIPFNYTTDIIHKITQAKNPPTDAYLFVQKEAAERFMGIPKETMQSLFTKAQFELSMLHRFSKEDFAPKPRVNTNLLHMHRPEDPAVSNENISLYKDFVSFILNQWKPNVKNALEKIFTYDQLKRLGQDLGFALESKPTELTFDQYIGMFNYFLKGVIPEKQKLLQNHNMRRTYQEKFIKKRYRSFKQKKESEEMKN